MANFNCTTCPNRVELHPEYKKKRWSIIPCSKCDFREQSTRDLHFNENVLYRKLDSLTCEADKTVVLTMLAHVFKTWLQFSDLQKQILTERILRPHLTKQQVARSCGVSRQSVHRTYRQLSVKYPVLKEILR